MLEWQYLSSFFVCDKKASTLGTGACLVCEVNVPDSLGFIIQKAVSALSLPPPVVT